MRKNVSSGSPISRWHVHVAPHRREIAAALVGLLGLLPGAPAAADPRYGDENLPETVRKQVRDLLPQRPGIMDTYAVIVGGDAGDEVFRKETMAVRAALDGRAGTQGRSVVLLNHRSLPAPEATFNSLRQVLQAIGRQMDPDEDVLWLHLASHGGGRPHLRALLPGPRALSPHARASASNVGRSAHRVSGHRRIGLLLGRFRAIPGRTGNVGCDCVGGKPSGIRMR